MNNSKTIIVLYLLLSIHSQVAAEDELLQSYRAEALANNPSLAAAQSSVDAARTQIPQAGALPDPMLGVGVQNLPSPSFNFQQEPMTGKWISLSQTFPFPGVRGLQRELAEDRAERYSSHATDVKQQLVREVERLYYRWAEQRRQIQLVEQNSDLLEQLIEVTTAAYRVGNAAQQDVLRAQTEWMKLDDELLALRQQEAELRTGFAALLGRNQADDLTAPDFDAAVPGDSLPAELDSLLLEHNPSLQSLEWELAAAKTNMRLAGRKKYPDFTLGAKYAQRDASPTGVERDDFWSFSLTTSIPIFAGSKQNRAYEQRSIEQKRAAEQISDLKNKLLTKLVELRSAIETHAQQVNLYETAIIPQAQQTFEAAMADYEVGRVGFSDLIAAQRELFGTQIMQAERLRRYYVARADMKALVGTDF